ncbi:gfo/Idh/MocA family oxidoreductase, partial [Pseudoalteromonas undina]
PNSQELNDLLSAAQASKRLYMAAMMTTLLPNFARLKSALEKIGTPRKCIGQYRQYSSRYDKYKNCERPNTFLPE